MIDLPFKRTMAALSIGLSAAVSLSANPLSVGYERFHAAPEADLVEAGELLIGELGCANCHQVSGELADRFPTRTGPDLDGIVARANQGWLRAWLKSPHATKAGTVMPDLLAGSDAGGRDQLAEALAAYLGSLEGEYPQLPAKARAAADAEAGRNLFHTIGCVACHEPEAGHQPGGESSAAEIAREVPSVSLKHVGGKYDLDRLAAFLADPLKHRPSARMPRVPTSLQERVNLAAYLIQANPALTKWPAVKPDASRIGVGKAAFARIGCASCHQLNDDGEAVQSGLKAKPLKALARSREWGCLSSTPKAGIPFYSLNDRQRAALAAALHNLPNAPQVSFAERSRKLMTALNCFACHQRDSLGGPEDGRKIHFHTSGQDLEDEGRFPPTLTGVGRKLLPAAMLRIMQGDGAVRPYMTTRMPDFGEAHARELAAMFPTLDIPKDEKPTPRDGEENQVGRNMWGRALVGAKGLSCIACHDLNGHRSLGIRAMDLANATKRLRPEWFRDYLIDPAKFRPGTRMPAFWPGGKPVLKGNGNSTSRQIDSIWAYLGELDQSRLPEGLEKTGNFELKPKDRPIVFRTFMEEVGMHAIAVGFPEGVHAAFDSRNDSLFWRLFWKGGFLDAESTWDDRFTPLAKPLGDSVVKPASRFPFDDPALAANVSPGPQQFLGIRKDEKGRPTLIYTGFGMRFEDTLIPGADGRSMRQRMLISNLYTEYQKRMLVYRPPTQLKPKVIFPEGGGKSGRGTIPRLQAEEMAVLLEFQAPEHQAELILEWKW
jgi:cytochrome c2